MSSEARAVTTETEGRCLFVCLFVCWARTSRCAPPLHCDEGFVTNVFSWVVSQNQSIGALGSDSLLLDVAMQDCFRVGRTCLVKTKSLGRQTGEWGHWWFWHVCGAQLKVCSAKSSRCSALPQHSLRTACKSDDTSARCTVMVSCTCMPLLSLCWCSPEPMERPMKMSINNKLFRFNFSSSWCSAG